MEQKIFIMQHAQSKWSRAIFFKINSLVWNKDGFQRFYGKSGRNVITMNTEQISSTEKRAMKFVLNRCSHLYPIHYFQIVVENVWKCTFNFQLAWLEHATLHCMHCLLNVNEVSLSNAACLSWLKLYNYNKCTWMMLTVIHKFLIWYLYIV